METVEIQRSRWRCGGTSPYVESKAGKGTTALLNPEGYMCCLGFACTQLCDLPEEAIYNKSMPDELGAYLRHFTENGGEGNFMNSSLSDEAARINDNGRISNQDREAELTNLFKAYGIEIEFVGKYE